MLHSDNSKIAFSKFKAQGDFFLRKAGYLTLTMITGGKAKIKINGNAAELVAPCIFLFSGNDIVELAESHQLAAKALSFQPVLVNKSLSIEGIAKDDFYEIADRHDCNLLKPFLGHGNTGGILNPLPQIYLRISEWFDLAYKEAKIKSGQAWLYCARRNLMQILFLLEDIYASPGEFDALSEESVVDTVLGHIHTDYPSEISLDSLCKLVYVNRTTLTRMFKARTRRSPIDYLLHYRLNIACELLPNSKMSICKIAETIGFNYESYFIRQFVAKIGLTPTQYRKCDGFEILNVNESRIVDEF